MTEHLEQMPEHQVHEDPVAQELGQLLRKLYDDACRRSTPAELRTIPFNGAQNLFEVTDDVGAPGLSYGLINPSEVKAFVNFAGGRARAGEAIEVPARSFLIMPLAVSGHVKIGVDQGELAEKSVQLHRLRFHSVQPFDAGAL